MVTTHCHIEIINSSFGYRKRKADVQILTNVNARLCAGDFVGIVGLNGSGKSTFLKSIGGLLPLLSGEVRLDGTAIGGISKQELAKKISLVLTEKIGGFNLTAFDAVAAGQLPYTNIFNTLTEENLSAIRTAMASCGLTEHSHKLLGELSDGLFQKTMIAKCLAQQTPVMFLDEPTAFLDYASKHELFLLLQKLAGEQRKCILVSSHDLDLILKYCNTIMLIANGSAEMMGADEARSHRHFKELSGGFL